MKRLAVLLTLLILALLAGCVQQQAPTADEAAVALSDFQKSTATDPSTSEAAEEDGKVLPTSDVGHVDLNIYGDTDLVPPAAWGDDDAREFWQGHFGDDLAQVIFEEVRNYRGKKGDNEISIDYHALTPIVSQLHAITTLRVKSSYYQDSFDNLDYLFELNLKTLTLAECGIRELSPAIGNMAELEYLDLSGNIFLTQLPDEMEQLTNLHTLMFHGYYGKNTQQYEEGGQFPCRCRRDNQLEASGVERTFCASPASRMHWQFDQFGILGDAMG